MNVQEIEVTIDKNGQVNVHVRGVKGNACLDITRDVEAALGDMVIERQMSSESDSLPPNIPLGTEQPEEVKRKRA